ncbi:MAG: Hpt domain-containing protein [Ignavibacteriales bacterium]|nr:Hpt domain-containing protein [Ignavibacteriales bacterium]
MSEDRIPQKASSFQSAQIKDKFKGEHFKPDELMAEKIMAGSFLVEIISQFIKNAPQELKKMSEQAEYHNFDAVRSAAHKAKSMYMYLKLHKASALIRKIEKYAVEKRDAASLLQLINQLSTLTGQIIIEMNNSVNQLRKKK